MKTLASLVLIALLSFLAGTCSAQDKSIFNCNAEPPSFVGGTQVPCVNVMLQPGYLSVAELEDWKKETADDKVANQATIDIATCLNDPGKLDVRCPKFAWELKQAADDICKRMKCGPVKKKRWWSR